MLKKMGGGIEHYFLFNLAVTDPGLCGPGITSGHSQLQLGTLSWRISASSLDTIVCLVSQLWCGIFTLALFYQLGSLSNVKTNWQGHSSIVYLLAARATDL